MTRSAAGARGRPWSVTALLAAAAVAVSVAAGAQQAASPSSTTSPPDVADYRIGAGDALQLFVWKEPDLTREVTVRIDGKISVALLGDVQAAGRSTRDLADDVKRGLTRFVADPMVTISVNQTRSTRFFVLGMVGRSGEFPMSSPTTVVQALAVAGGLKEYAKSDAIVIVRQEGGKSTFVPVNYKRLVSDRDGSQNIPLRPGDTVLVP
jgi:polysaccharide export outer membrane protein